MVATVIVLVLTHVAAFAAGAVVMSRWSKRSAKGAAVAEQIGK